MKAATYQAEGIRISSFLSKLPMIGRETKKTVLRMIPEEIVPVLKAAEVDFVLVGAHGIAGWLEEPRATQDVDFLIRQKGKAKASEAILRKYKDLELEKHRDVWRYLREGKYVLDLMFDTSPLYKRVLTEFVESPLGRRKIKVPKVEAALAMKFAAMTGFYRKDKKKYLDASDFIGLVENNKQIDLSLLADLGELVYPGGGMEAVDYVKDVRAGKRLEI